MDLCNRLGLILPLHQSGENKDKIFSIQSSDVIFNHPPLLLTTILKLDQSNLNSISCVSYIELTRQV